MNCQEAEAFLTVLHDGGGEIPGETARHIVECGNCRSILESYARIGTELRIAASILAEPAAAAPVPSKASWLPQLLTARVALPRVALAGLATACLVLATLAAFMTSAVLAQQSKPLWFQFSYGLQKGGASHYSLAQNGYDETSQLMAIQNGSFVGAKVRVQIEKISLGEVVVRIRAVPPVVETAPDGSSRFVAGNPPDQVVMDTVRTIHYKPGDWIEVPIEGAPGTLYLHGEVFDRQPKLAIGIPLEPPTGQMVVRWPVLVAGANRVVADLAGATAIANDDSTAVHFGAGKNGNFIFAMRPFPGAVAGEANWGQIAFKLDGTTYRLMTAAPITSGDQPRQVWVRRDPPPAGDDSGVRLGSRRLEEMAQNTTK
jgi:hypothetical protein